MGKTTTSVTLRERERKGGKRSLYLDIYAGGRRRTEYLKLYLVPEKTARDREENKRTRQLAEAIRGQRLVELQNGTYGFSTKEQAGVLFYPYYEKVMNERPLGTSTSGAWATCLSHIRAYDGREGLEIGEIDRRWLEGFLTYLDAKDDNGNKLKDGTKSTYYGKLKACLNQAVRDGIISQNPANGVRGYKHREAERVYLTLEELRAMAVAECDDQVLKRAFLFSCLTGLRVSDVMMLTWGEVSRQGGYTRITFRQKKTGGLEYLDITPEAVEYMGERGEPSRRVFAGLMYSSTTSQKLRVWALRAGVNKKLTYHSSRHTFAVMMIELGTDLYTVQKLLGHKDIKTTQRYAKVLDSKKQEAVSRIPRIRVEED